MSMYMYSSHRCRFTNHLIYFVHVYLNCRMLISMVSFQRNLKIFKAAEFRFFSNAIYVLPFMSTLL